MYYWYKLLTYLLHFFSPIYIFIRRIKKKEHPTRYKEKLSRINVPRGEGFLLWFHVASIGEAISIFPLIENLERTFQLPTVDPFKDGTKKIVDHLLESNL